MFTRIPLRLRFIEAVEGGESGGSEAEQAPVENAEPAQQTEQPTGNPAWEGIRSQLDPISFSRIEPELSKFDQSVQSRIQSVNEQLKPWKPFIDQEVQPELVQTALQLQENLNANPAAIYQYLGDFLQKTGRMPTQSEVQKADAAGEIEGDGEEEATNPELDELRQGQEQILQFFAAQQQAEIEKQADESVSQEISAFKAAHSDLSDADVKEILARAAFEAQQNFAAGKKTIPTLQSVHDGWFTELRTRFLSTPRPGDSAPKLLPTGGAIPSNGPKQSLGQLSSQDVQSIIAAGLQQGR